MNLAKKVLPVAGLACVLSLPAGVLAQTATDQQQSYYLDQFLANVKKKGGIGGITQPIRTQNSRPTFNQPGVILEVPIKPGDHVKQGQLLVRQDDRLELARKKAAELEADSTAKVDEAEANLKVKKSVLSRKEKTFKENALSAQELEEAQLDVIDGEARLKIAQLDLAKAKVEVEGEDVKIDQMRLKAPFDGVVESVDTSVGEVSDPTKPVCSIVRTDTLWVEIRNMPTSWAGKLNVGDKLEVRYDEQYAGTPIYDQQWVPAQVVYKAPVANAESDTQLVRLAMPNTRGLAAGLQVVVKLPDSVINPAAGSASASGTPAAITDAAGPAAATVKP